MCDYRMQRFYFLNFESHAVLSNMKLVNMALSKQQHAGKLAKKTLSLDERFKFLDFVKGFANA